MTVEAPEIQLTDEQQAAIDFVKENLVFGTVAIAGPAGSGKTTLIKKLIEELSLPVTVSAMTNKARHVLIQKGILEALTLHQACLKPKFRPPLDRLDKYLNECKRCKNSFGADVCYCDCSCNGVTDGPGGLKTVMTSCTIHGIEARYIAPQLGVTTSLMREAWDVNKTSGIYSAFRLLGIKDVFKYIEAWVASEPKEGILIIDEASMLGSVELELAKKVFKFIILIGDEYQLPPVSGEPVFWQVPTRFSLTHIHRQAAGSQPLQLAEKLRRKESIECGPVEIIDADLCRAGMPVIVWRNKTRVELTATIRKKIGYDGLPPQVGEMLICRNGSDKAAKSRGLFNNSIWKVTWSQGFRCHLENQAGDVLENENVLMEELENGSGTPFRFAYALTCHASQGSEWSTVMIHEPDAWGYMRALPQEVWPFLYTSVTRAKDRVVWVGDQ